MGLYWAEEFGAPMELRGLIRNPPQIRKISGTRTRKSAGENQKPNPKPANSKPADIRPEPDPLHSQALLSRSTVSSKSNRQHAFIQTAFHLFPSK